MPARLLVAMSFAAAFALLVPGPIDVFGDGVAHAQRRKKKPQPRTALVQINSLTEGAEIFMDGELIATVPMDGPIELAPGEHSVKVAKPGYADFFETIDFPASFDVQYVEADLIPVAAIVKIESTPTGANVLVDGELRGETPFSGEVEGGKRSLSVTRSGFVPWKQEIDMVAGEVYELDAPLKAVIVEEPFYTTWWFWTGVGVLVAATATTIVLASGDDGGSQGPPATDGVIDLRRLELRF